MERNLTIAPLRRDLRDAALRVVYRRHFEGSGLSRSGDLESYSHSYSYAEPDTHAKPVTHAKRDTHAKPDTHGSAVRCCTPRAEPFGCHSVYNVIRDRHSLACCDAFAH